MIKKILLFLLGITAVVGNNFPLFNIGLVSFFPLRFIIIICVIYILLFKKESKVYLKHNLITLIFFCFLIIKSLISLLITEDISSNLSVFLIYLTSLMIVLILVLLITEEKDLQTVLWGYSLGVLIVSLIGIYEAYTGNYLIYNTSYDYKSVTHRNMFNLNYPLVQFHNINNLSTFLTLSIPLVGMIDHKNNNILFVKIIITLLIIINIILGESRGALIALIIISLIITYNYLRKIKIRKSYIYIFLLPFSFYFIPILINQLKNSNIIREVRFKIWSQMIAALSETLFTGVGIGNSGKSISLVLNSTVSQDSAAHNYLLEIFTEFGLIVFLLIFLWLLKMFLESSLTSKDIEIKTYLILFLIMTIVPSTMLGMYFVWLGFGINLSYIGLSKKSIISC